MDVLESYTWTIDYQDDIDGSKLLSGISIQEDSHAQKFTLTIADVKLGLQDFIRNLSASCGSMPRLPGTFHVYAMYVLIGH